nr:hypothetical protein [Tanacetum cinerariifolium]
MYNSSVRDENWLTNASVCGQQVYKGGESVYEGKLTKSTEEDRVNEERRVDEEVSIRFMGCGYFVLCDENANGIGGKGVMYGKHAPTCLETQSMCICRRHGAPQKQQEHEIPELKPESKLNYKL